MGFEKTYRKGKHHITPCMHKLPMHVPQEVRMLQDNFRDISSNLQVASGFKLKQVSLSNENLVSILQAISQTLESQVCSRCR